jgi:isopentenyl-diphosphate delta-isomerase
MQYNNAADGSAGLNKCRTTGGPCTGARMSIQEHVILVDDQGLVLGTQEKYAAHTSHTPLHLAFSSWLFNAR